MLSVVRDERIQDWSDCSWCCFVKLKVSLPNSYQLRSDGLGDDYSCLFHVGFLFIEETDKQLARLREGRGKKQAKPARSKISRSNLREINAIDRVAALVLKERTR